MSVLDEPVPPPPTHCDDCGEVYDTAWFTDNVFWNAVMTPLGVAAMDDPGGLLCIPCFRKRAEVRFDVAGWKLTPQWPWIYR